MVSLRRKLQDRVEQKFFGTKVNSSLQHLPRHKSEKFEREALSVYRRAIEYLESRYDSGQSLFKDFAIINLETNEISYEKVLDAAKAVKLCLNRDRLFDEIQMLKSAMPAIKNLKPSSDLKWVRIFPAADFEKLPKLVAKILSIPISNAVTERIFPIMAQIWTDSRNKMRVELVKAELFVISTF